MMPRLFTYTIPIDDGAAPNPFVGLCTLAICKPGIRRVARPGDWVAGLGSRNAPGGRDLSGHLVYAMLVEEVLTLREYDQAATSRWPHRIPNLQSKALQDRLGDCIYDYSVGSEPILRPSVHGVENIKTDLGGSNVLISTDFYYFGSKAVKVPPQLRNICHQTQGYRSNSNQPYFESFVNWMRSNFTASGQLYGWPDYVVNWEQDSYCGNCMPRIMENQNDVGC